MNHKIPALVHLIFDTGCNSSQNYWLIAPDIWFRVQWLEDITALVGPIGEYVDQKILEQNITIFSAWKEDLQKISISCIILQESVIIKFFYYSWNISKKWKTEFHFLGVISKKVSFWQEIALKQKFLTRNLHFLGYLIFLFLKYSISFFVTKIPTKSF